MLRRTIIPGVLLTVLASAGGACTLDVGESATPKREFQQFQREVYPVLMRDCGFPACHGDPRRFFRVWGPGRARLPTDTGLPEAFDLPTGDEIGASYQLALSMINDEQPEHSLLLQKPLAIDAGGSGHIGVDKYGRDVYRTADDSGYVALARWVFSGEEPAP